MHSKNPGGNLLWDVEETARKLRISRSKLLDLSYKKQIPSIKVGKRRLYVAEHILAWLNRGAWVEGDNKVQYDLARGNNEHLATP